MRTIFSLEKTGRRSFSDLGGPPRENRKFHHHLLPSVNLSFSVVRMQGAHFLSEVIDQRAWDDEPIWRYRSIPVAI
jgi:hypothetical protein